MRDASLDEFLGGSESSEDESGDATDGVDDSGDTPESDAGADAGAESETDDTDTEEDSRSTAEDAPAELTVEPATPTYDWSPEGAECAECGAVVETRWHTEGVGLVCAECKVW